MRTEVSQLPLDDVLFPPDNVFLNHSKCLFPGLGLGVAGKGEARQL